MTRNESSGFKRLMNEIKTGKYTMIHQFLKFGIVGISNTAISYGIEMLCYYAVFINVPWSENIKIVITSALAFIISVTNSYYWNNRFVFISEKKTRNEHLMSYMKTIACYGITGLILAPVIKMLLNSRGVAYWVASLGALIITIPLNFILNKYWAFRRK